MEFTSKKYKQFEFSVDGKKYKLPNFKSLTSRQIKDFQDEPLGVLDEMCGKPITKEVPDEVLTDVIEAWTEFDDEAGKK